MLEQSFDALFENAYNNERNSSWQLILFSLFFSVTEACMPAANLALEDVNNKQDLLPDFQLTLHSNDSEVSFVELLIKGYLPKATQQPSCLTFDAKASSHLFFRSLRFILLGNTLIETFIDIENVETDLVYFSAFNWESFRIYN